MNAKRPPQDLFLHSDELLEMVAEMADAAGAILGPARPGLVLGSLFLDGVRGLRLPLQGGFATRPADKDRQASFVPERSLGSAGELAAFRSDLMLAAASAFKLGDTAQPRGPAGNGNEAPYVGVRHGLTKRTERRLAGLRAHGS
jgi:hypothetical protein